MGFLPWVVVCGFLFVFFFQATIWITQEKASIARTDTAAHYFKCAEDTDRKATSRPAIHLKYIIRSSTAVTSSQYLSQYLSQPLLII